MNAQAKPNPVNRDVAREFCRLIAGDGAVFIFHGQAPKDDPRGKITRQRTARFDDALAELETWEAGGLNIYVRPNGGPKRADVTEARVISVDFDAPGEGHLKSQAVPVTWHAPPSLITRRGKSVRAHWLLDKSFPIGRFQETEARLISNYKADPNARGLEHPWRVPGFKHPKYPDQAVELEIDDDTILAGKRYTIEEIEKGLPPLVDEPPRENSVPSAPSGLPVSPALIEVMLRHVNPSCDRSTWISIAGALMNAPVREVFGEFDGLDYFTRWSSGEYHGEAPGNFQNSEDCETTWNSLKADRKGGSHFGTLVKLARDGGYTGPSDSFLEFAEACGATPNDKAPQENSRNDFDPTDFGSDSDLAPSGNRWEKITRRGDEILNIPPGTYAVPGWLRDTGYVSLLADRGTGKTLVAVNLALSIATDQPWFGEPVTPGFYAVYLCGEDQENTAAHITAWCSRHNEGNVPDRFIFIEDVPDLTTKVDCKALELHLRSILPLGARVVLMTDTWQRATARARDGQNDDSAMAAAVENLEALARTFRGPAVGCFHPPKDGRATVHGSYVIENMSTSIWHLTMPPGGLRLEVIRLKGKGEGNYKLLRKEEVSLGSSKTGAIMVTQGGSHSPTIEAQVRQEQEEMEAVFAKMKELLQKDIQLTRNGRSGQGPKDVAAALKKGKASVDIDWRKISSHAAELERQGRLVYLDADKNKRGHKAGWRLPDRAPEEIPNQI